MGAVIGVARLGTIKLVERSPFVGLGFGGLGFCDAARVLFREACMKKKMMKIVSALWARNEKNTD